MPKASTCTADRSGGTITGISSRCLEAADWRAWRESTPRSTAPRPATRSEPVARPRNLSQPLGTKQPVQDRCMCRSCDGLAYAMQTMQSCMAWRTGTRCASSSSWGVRRPWRAPGAGCRSTTPPWDGASPASSASSARSSSSTPPTGSCSPTRVRASARQPSKMEQANGLGVGALTCCLGDAHPRLRRVFPDHPAHRVDLWLVVHADVQRTGRIRALIAALDARCREAAAVLRG